MNERALRVLEFVKIRQMLSSYALTDGGRELCEKLQPCDKIDEARKQLDLTDEATIILAYNGGNPLTGFEDLADALTLAEKGAVLSTRMILNVASCLRASRGARNALVTERENTPLITGIASNLVPLQQLERDIEDAILSEEEIADTASPALADIRRHIRQSNEKIREKLNTMAHSSQYSKYLMENIVTVRDGRYVLPVKAECRSNVPGLVHDQSATGATLFVEPLAIVELGNVLKEWKAKEREEIQRILQSLSADIGSSSGIISRNAAILSDLDFIFARGMLARDMEAVKPELNDKGIIRFIRVRHPLIDREKVVPCDLWLGEDFTSLIITGPNTGGKTVTLKTVGLMVLMAQSGLHIPGMPGTKIAVFDQVYADIGDEQSIEQSLSTFSSHMTNITSIVNSVKKNDLVLFDELGAGTDPVEGAALAQSILDSLLQKGIRTVATTHYSELKVYALTTKGVENASVEFDVSTLRPTYRLSIGVPGKSNAFEISRKLGLPEQLIENAKALLNHESVAFEDVIANAEYHRQIAQKERELAEQARMETVRLRNEAERIYKDLEEKKESSTRKAKEEARRIVEKARRDSEIMISELKRMKKNATVPDHEINALRKQLDAQIDELAPGLPESKADSVTSADQIKPGMTVEVLTLNTKGQVLSAPDARGDVSVQAGIMKTKVHFSALRILKEEAQKPKVTVHARTSQGTKTVKMSCDVRGMALDEAIQEVDRYLDDATLAGLNEVTIVHGKGMGILRSGIQQHLKKHHLVKSSRLGVFGEGEDGVTVVTLK
ncbi:MAG: endonuclease MutS2 [Clostridiales bacterium]|nr:endonuclease MutS2 [Clostridiales bacterium]